MMTPFMERQMRQKIIKSTSKLRKSIIVFTKSISEFGKSIIVFAKWIVMFAKSITEFDYRVSKIYLSCLQNRLANSVCVLLVHPSFVPAPSTRKPDMAPLTMLCRLQNDNIMQKTRWFVPL